MSDEADIVQIRHQIDILDEQIQACISQRAGLAQQVAQIKQASANPVIYRPEREAEILKKVMARNQGPLSQEVMGHMFQELMSACRALECPLKVAYLGPEGTFTQVAMLKRFGHFIESVPQTSIDEIFREVESQNVDFGVVPVENSTEGGVTHTLDSFIQSPLKICGEIAVRIHHFLLSREQAIAAIQKIYSHQQSFAQCRHWLNANMKQVPLIVVSSNAEAARLAAQEAGSAAVAGETAGRTYGLNTVAKNIEDEADNTTRFFVIGKQSSAKSSVGDKTSLLLTAHNVPGALYTLLRPLADHDISMTRIESRPSRKAPWDYVFFVDIEGHQDDTKVHSALSALKQEAAFVKILGSYPKAQT